MRKAYRIQTGLWCFLVSILISCQEGRESVAPGVVQFSFSAAGAASRAHAESTPAFVSFLLRRPDNTRISVRRELTELSGSYITEPEQLVPGDYTLEQFFILDRDQKSIYASPIAGSELAELVEHPLPLAFTVVSDHVTTVIPEVLETENQTAEGFGYVSLSFDVVSVTAFRLPVMENTAITKISYELRQGSTIIASEITTSGRLVVLQDDRLNEGTWQARIWAWTDAQTCYKEVYRYQGTLTFTGALQQLPGVTDSRWARFYHTQKQAGEHTVDFFLSADPRTNFRLELSIPTASGIHGYFDRAYWTSDDSQLCDITFSEIYGNSFVQASIADSPDCHEVTPDEIDSNVSFTIVSDGESHHQYYFLWKVLSTGEIVPVCN